MLFRYWAIRYENRTNLFDGVSFYYYCYFSESYYVCSMHVLRRTCVTDGIKRKSWKTMSSRSERKTHQCWSNTNCNNVRADMLLTVWRDACVFTWILYIRRKKITYMVIVAKSNQLWCNGKRRRKYGDGSTFSVSFNTLLPHNKLNNKWFSLLSSLPPLHRSKFKNKLLPSYQSHNGNRGSYLWNINEKYFQTKIAQP